MNFTYLIFNIEHCIVDINIMYQLYTTILMHIQWIYRNLIADREKTDIHTKQTDWLQYVETANSRHTTDRQKTVKQHTDHLENVMQSIRKQADNRKTGNRQTIPKQTAKTGYTCHTEKHTEKQIISPGAHAQI